MQTFMSNAEAACHQCLHNPNHRSARIINGILVFLILASIAIIPLHFIPDLEKIYPYLFLFDKITVTIFTLEYGLRIWSAPQPGKYIFSLAGLIDLVAILPFYLASLGIITNPVIFLSLRILRLLKLGKMYDNTEEVMTQTNTNHGHFFLAPNEKIERVIQKHPIVFIVSLLVPLALTMISVVIMGLFSFSLISLISGGVLMILAIIFFTKAWLDHLYDLIYITNQRVMVQNRKLFGSICNDMPYGSITNVIPDNRGFIPWALKFGDILIETAAGNSPTVRNVPRPHEIVTEIAEKRQKAQEELEKL